MTSTALGGGSSAVAASTHAACARFRGTDPLVVGRTRRRTAIDIGFADDSGGIPQARWTRAMIFEHLVRDPRFASEVATTTLGRLGLDRPAAVVTADAGVGIERTAALLEAAHERAVAGGEATLVHGLALPFPGFEAGGSTEVKPDFAVVAPAPARDCAPAGSWLIVGDAKDYERVRSRIEDARLLKGYLQVAVGAESAARWSRLPAGMAVHSHGALAVPRNAFLQPEPLVERLDDHREEVRMRIAERGLEAAALAPETGPGLESAAALSAFVAHLQATFDPASCTTCTLFSYCRDELRSSADPADLLVELGIPEAVRPRARALLDGPTPDPRAPDTPTPDTPTPDTPNLATPPPASVAANITATLTGLAQRTGQRRVDQAGRPGAINLVLAKSDAAALGVHGIGLRRGAEPWRHTVFDDPQAPETRLAVMRLLGGALAAAMSRAPGEDTPDSPERADPVHLVVPDAATADILASIADNLAGIELSRLRWARDVSMGREPLTFGGEPARVPAPLDPEARVGVSFLLEEDRARAFALRSPVIDLRAALARHVVPGGPVVAAHRLDYLAGWAEATPGRPLDPRAFEDLIEQSPHTPGARLSNRRSDAIHQSLSDLPAEPARYAELVAEELDYKGAVLDRALAALAAVPDSALRPVYRALEGDAQAVWRRRIALHASDLVRFGRTYRHWRNALVPAIEADGTCQSQLQALANPQSAHDRAADAGVRELAHATVVATAPITLDVASRRLGDGARIVLVHHNGEACVEAPQIEITPLGGSFRLGGLSIGPLSADPDEDLPRRLRWDPQTVPDLAVGDRLVIADFAWFSANKGNAHLNVARPKPDAMSAPRPDCAVESYPEDPEGHQYCCRPHEDAEADWSDQLAERRERGELNPQAWPPLVDGDAFDVLPIDAPAPLAPPADSPPEHLTIEDLE